MKRKLDPSMLQEHSAPLVTEQRPAFNTQKIDPKVLTKKPPKSPAPSPGKT
ncbi:MAG: hypothetical protein HC904_06655 [Blastochloris sp.]|nr:hypothetical protein [Blastochloris sp.]